MSIFATARWDSDSDTPFDEKSDALKTITNSNHGKKILDSRTKKIKNTGKKHKFNMNNKRGENGDKSSSNKKKKLERLRTAEHVKAIIPDSNFTTHSSITNKQSNGSLKKRNVQRNRSSDRHQKDLKMHRTKVKVASPPSLHMQNENTTGDEKDNKLDTAIRKVALYRKLKEIEKNKTVKKDMSVDSQANHQRKKNFNKLQQILEQENAKKNTDLPGKVLTLKQRMEEKLKAARFRFLNEQIYTTNSKEAQKIFNKDPEAFKAYHEGYRQQVKKWPINPLDIIIRHINKMPKASVIADFGCGEAKLAKSVQQKVYSFDLIALDDLVIACDMAHVPLQNYSVDSVVFCLSLMGTNLGDYILEANRILKIGGVMKIVEVVSRFGNIDEFTQAVLNFGFKIVWKDLSHNYFYFVDFKKISNIKNKKKLTALKLNIQPCSYKKR